MDRLITCTPQRDCEIKEQKTGFLQAFESELRLREASLKPPPNKHSMMREVRHAVFHNRTIPYKAYVLLLSRSVLSDGLRGVNPFLPSTCHRIQLSL